jgi:aminoglycoside/choline kinase family phosphotransferase
MRREDRARFLAAAGWGEAAARPLAGDASTRSYERLEQAGDRAILMNAPPRAEAAACPPDASVMERRALGYNALARLAGPNLHAFLAIAEALRDAGLSAPEIYAADPSLGFALIEDLGDDLFARAIPAGADEGTLYAAAVDALLRLREAAPRPPKGEHYVMLAYDRIAMEAEIALLTDWYWPLGKGAPAPSSLAADYFAAWAPVLDMLSPPAVMALRDYHAENLLWLPEREGAARVGLIDFQDGLVGHAAYDLVSLLEDARRDVAPEIAEAMIAHYCEGAGRPGAFDEGAFRRDYAVLAAQRNAKILGVFARLVKRDGKPRYLDFLPRVEAHFRRDLARPELAPVRRFFAQRMPELAE